MEFTKQEIELLKRLANTTMWDHWIWEIVYLVPSIALIALGALEGSKRSIYCWHKRSGNNQNHGCFSTFQEPPNFQGIMRQTI